MEVAYERRGERRDTARRRARRGVLIMFVVGDEVQSGDSRRSGSSRAESLALAQAVIPAGC
jgi:hypothetical protein